MGIDINNELLIMSIFTFGISWFTAYAFMRCFLIAKIFVLIFALKIVEGLALADSIPMTLIAFAGALFGFFGGIRNTIEAFRNFTETVTDIGAGIIDFFTAIFRGIFNFFSAVKCFFEKESESKQSQNKASKEKQKKQENQQRQQKSNSSNEEEKVKQRKEEFRQAREEENNKKDDSRSYEEILGLHTGYTTQELKKMYKTLTARYHPDRYHHMSDEYRKEAEEEFKKVKKSYEILLKKFD